MGVERESPPHCSDPLILVHSRDTSSLTRTMPSASNACAVTAVGATMVVWICQFSSSMREVMKWEKGLADPSSEGAGVASAGDAGGVGGAGGTGASSGGPIGAPLEQSCSSEQTCTAATKPARDPLIWTGMTVEYPIAGHSRGTGGLEHPLEASSTTSAATGTTTFPMTPFWQSHSQQEHCTRGHPVRLTSGCPQRSWSADSAGNDPEQHRIPAHPRALGSSRSRQTTTHFPLCLLCVTTRVTAWLYAVGLWPGSTRTV